MRQFEIPCTWEMSGMYIVESESFEEALNKIKLLPLPDNGNYVGYSFKAYEDEVTIKEIE